MSQPTLDELIAIGDFLSQVEDEICAKCGSLTITGYGREPTGLCDDCAQEIACNAIVPLARAHQSALEKIARLREIEPQIRLIVETVAPELARELSAILAELGKGN